MASLPSLLRTDTRTSCLFCKTSSALTRAFASVGKASNFCDLVATATHLKPDVIIADIALPGMKELITLQKLAADCGQAKIILSLQHRHLPVISKAIEAGFAGYIMHNAKAAEYDTAIRQAMKGGIFYCSQAEKIINTGKNEGNTGITPGRKVSKTQCTLLYCLWIGFNSKEAGRSHGP